MPLSQPMTMLLPSRIIFRRSFSQSAQKHASAPSPGAIQTSILPNNVFVATKGPEQAFPSFSICLAAGSRYEIPSTPGLAHFFKHSLFLSNKQESALALTRLQELRGSQISVNLTRELLTITASCTHDTLMDTMQSVGYMLHPRKIEEHELQNLAEKVAFERDILLSDPKNFLLEQVQSVAFRTEGLGNSIICAREHEGKATAKALLDFFLRSMLHQGTSAVAVGVKHDVFTRALPSKVLYDLHFTKFGDMPFLEPEYYGGEARFESSGGSSYATMAFPLKDGMSNVNSFAMGRVLERLYIPDTPVPYGNQLCLLFGNEGPFAGIKTFSGSAQLYSNAGLLSFTLAAENGTYLKDALKRIRFFNPESISAADLARAKAAALFNLRSKYDDSQGFMLLASEQVLGSGSVFDLAKLQTALQAITLEDVHKAAKEAFGREPSFVTYGNLRELPYLDEI